MPDLVSIVLASYNGAAHIGRTLDAIRRQGGGVPFELVVVNDGSTDGTPAAAAASLRGAPFPFLVLDLPANAGKAHALNSALARTVGSLLAFLDDDIVADPGWLAAHAAAHAAAPRAVACIGPVRYPPDWVRASNLVRYRAAQCAAVADTGRAAPRNAGIDCFAGGNFSIRREALLRVGGFDAALRRGEDRELAVRLRKNGIPLWWVAGAGVTHYEREALSYGQLGRKYQAFYRREARLVEQLHPDDRDLTGRWCLQAADPAADSLWRRTVKRAVRLAGRPSAGRRLFRILERLDGRRWAYSRRLYQYAFLCLALEALARTPDAAPSRPRGDA